jgi:hypothetical protein
MKIWTNDPFSASYNGNFHLAPGSPGIIGGVCCPETTGGSDIDGETGWCAASCASASTGVGADYFRDTDNDGIANRYDCDPDSSGSATVCEGDAYTASQEAACSFPGAYDYYVNPGAAEICDGKDNNCDGFKLSGGEDDADLDGYFVGASGCSPNLLDCGSGPDLDGNPTIHPGAQELCDSKDNDCNGQVDDMGSFSCGVGACKVTVQNCLNGVRQLNCIPGSPSGESLSNLASCFDNVDNDCDGQVDNDCGTNIATNGLLVVNGAGVTGNDLNLTAASADDTYEVFDETPNSGSTRQLTLVWTFTNPTGGLLHDLFVEGFRAYGNDNFVFSKATRSSGTCTASESWSPTILTLSNTPDNDQLVVASTDSTGPVTCIRLKDSLTSGDSTTDEVTLDRLFILPTPVAISEVGPNPGTKTGTLTNTRTSDDVREEFVEQTSGGGKKLTHTWRFDNVPAGSSHKLNLEGSRTNAGGDNFKFYYSTDGVNFPDTNLITTLSSQLEPAGGIDYSFGGSTLSGTIWIQVRDVNPSNSSATTLKVDRLAIKTVP